MNSQQELLNAINAISESKDKSFDTPATVLRVEDDTVWVHIDGGADETPVRKTVSCEQGETVQVRISNGSAFLVGNASAPPTDDKVANVAHFVAEQAEEIAVEASKSVEALSQTVEGKVDSGDSNITSLSSTLYQNASGVNVFNDTLAVGDSYAHIDGDSFDIKEVTTAGQIDDANDITLAKFGANETIIGSVDADGNRVSISGDGVYVINETVSPVNIISGWLLTSDKIQSYRSGILLAEGVSMTNSEISFSDPISSSVRRGSEYGIGNASLTLKTANNDLYETNIEPSKITMTKTPAPITGDVAVEIGSGKIKVSGDVYDYNNGYKKTPTVLTSTELAASATSYTFYAPMSDLHLFDNDPVIDIYDTIFGFAPTGCTINGTTCTVTFPAQSSSHTIKLFVY